MTLSISTRTIEPDVTVLELSGRMTLSRESNQVEPMVAALLAKGVRKIIFDVAGVNYVDSSGMGQIAFSASKIVQSGGKCQVAGATGLVLDVFRITRIDSVVPFADTVEEAAAALKAA